jgi:hypothetical protein
MQTKVTWQPRLSRAARLFSMHASLMAIARAFASEASALSHTVIWRGCSNAFTKMRWSAFMLRLAAAHTRAQPLPVMAKQNRNKSTRRQI